MNRLAWWIADKLSLALDPHESAVVRGDLTELGVNGLQAAREILGLVIRRRLQPWQDWRPWLALCGIILPLGWFLTTGSLSLARKHAQFLFLVVERLANGQPLSAIWFLAVLSSLPVALLLILQSWTTGLVAAKLARRTAGTQALLFILLFPCAGAVYFNMWPPKNSPALVLQLGVPLLFQLGLFIIPAWMGFRRGVQQRLFTTRRIRLIALAVLLLEIGFTINGLQHARVASEWLLFQSVRLLLFWPAFYLLWPRTDAPLINGRSVA